jgi:hypothetical protein
MYVCMFILCKNITNTHTHTRTRSWQMHHVCVYGIICMHICICIHEHILTHPCIQAHRRKENMDKAREAYTEGTSKCPNSINLWLVAARFEVESGQVPYMLTPYVCVYICICIYSPSISGLLQLVLKWSLDRCHKCTRLMCVCVYIYIYIYICIYDPSIFEVRTCAQACSGCTC